MTTQYDTALVVKRAVFNALASATDTTLVAAVSGRAIRVLAVALTSTGNCTLRFESGTGGTALTGILSLVEGRPMVWPYQSPGWIQTATGSLLNAEVTTGTSVNGVLLYVEV